MKRRELKDRLELLDAVIEASSDIIIITNPKGNILVWNSGAKKFLGYQGKEVAGKNVLDLIADERGEKNGVGLGSCSGKKRGSRIIAAFIAGKTAVQSRCFSQSTWFMIKSDEFAAWLGSPRASGAKWISKPHCCGRIRSWNFFL